MQRKSSKFFLGLSVFVWVACSHQGESHQSSPSKSFTEIKVQETSAEIKLPFQIWDLIEGKSVEEKHGSASHSSAHEAPAAAADAGHGGPAASAAGEHGAAPADGHGGGASSGPVDFWSSVTVQFAPLAVYVEEKNPGVLREPRMKIEFPQGGGRLNLSDYTTDQRGSFYFRIDVQEDKEDSLHVYYISGGRKRRIDEDEVGTGCGKILNLKNFYLSQLKSKGLLVNTTRDRHLTLLAGTYVFAYKKEASLFLSQLTVDVDGPKKVLTCDGIQNAHSPTKDH